MSAETVVRLPRRFFDDHESRDLPTPPTLRETKRHVWVDPYADPAAWAELVSDILFYAGSGAPDGYPEMNRAARATLAAIEKAAALRLPLPLGHNTTNSEG